MRSRIRACIVLFLIFFFVPRSPVHASQEFSTTLKVMYSVNLTGATTVKNEIHIKNNFSSIYAKQYALEVSSNQLQDIRAYTQDDVELPTNATQTDTKTSIAIEFPDKLVGKDQERVFFIEYLHPEVSILAGNVLEVNIPKLVDPNEFQEYEVTLAVPESFGDPAITNPSSFATQKSDGMTQLKFFKNAKNGINVIFGDRQVFSFTLTYNLRNPSISQGISQVALPPDTSFQKVIFDSINPKPEKIEKDEDGNWIATFIIASQKDVVVTAQGHVVIYLQPFQLSEKYKKPDNIYLAEQQYWEVTDPEIQTLAKKYKTPREIYDFLVTEFSYSYDRLNQSSQTRMGAIRALANPTQALCQEFTDTFIAIARAAGIPARELNGYAYTENSKLRPLSLVTDVLHAWPEYYDDQKQQWIPIDPTWGNTTGGVDFFTKLDFNHIVFARHGISSTRPFPAGVYKIEGKESKDVEIKIEKTIPEEIMDMSITVKKDAVSSLGMSNKTVVVVENKSGLAWYDIPVTTTTSGGMFVSKDTLKNIDVLLPYQHVEIPITVESTNTLVTQEGKVVVEVGGKSVTYEAVTAKNFTPVYLGIGVGTSVLVAGGLLVFWKKRRGTVRW